jgi:hypothetical protein
MGVGYGRLHSGVHSAPDAVVPPHHAGVHHRAAFGRKRLRHLGSDAEWVEAMVHHARQEGRPHIMAPLCLIPGVYHQYVAYPTEDTLRHLGSFPRSRDTAVSV